jgi:hypothetical protein
MKTAAPPPKSPMPCFMKGKSGGLGAAWQAGATGGNSFPGFDSRAA